MIFFAFDAKGGEKLGVMHGFRGSSWTSHGDSISFASACYSSFIRVELFVLHCTFNYCVAWICDLNLNLVWFVICDELCWLVILSWFMFILWLIEVVLILSSSYHTYILYVVLPRFPLVGETPTKFLKFMNMCSWYSFKSICTYQGGVLSTYL